MKDSSLHDSTVKAENFREEYFRRTNIVDLALSRTICPGLLLLKKEESSGFLQAVNDPILNRLPEIFFSANLVDVEEKVAGLRGILKFHMKYRVGWNEFYIIPHLKSPDLTSQNQS